MRDWEMQVRVEFLERRVAALEAALRQAGAKLDEPPAAPPLAPPPAPPTPPTPPAPPTPPLVQAAMPQSLPDAQPDAPPESHAKSQPDALPAAPPSAPPIAAQAHPAQHPPRDARQLERFVGMKVAAWAGGIIVIAGIALFARYAISEGWFGGMSPTGKLIISYAAALGFAVAGLALRKQVGGAAASSLLAIGLGGFYVATCAGVQPFGVVDPLAALVIAGLIAVGGAVLTLRLRQLAAAGISILGAYLVPAFTLPGALQFALPAGQVTFAGAYYSAIYAVALASARFGPEPFPRLRSFGLLQAAVACLMISQLHEGAPLVTTIFLTLWWLMATFECVLTAYAGKSPRASVGFVVGATVVAAPFAVIGALKSDPWTSPYSWVPLVLAAACAMGALVLNAAAPRGGADESDRLEDPQGAAVADACRMLSGAFVALVAALLMVQVGVLVRGGSLPVCWAAMGGMAAFTARRMGNRALAVIGLISMVPAFGVAVFLVIADLFYASPTIIAEWGWGSGITAWHVHITDQAWAPLLVCLLLAVTARAWNTPLVSAGLRWSGAAVLPGVLAALLWCALSGALADGYASMSFAMLGGLAAASLGSGGALSRWLAGSFVILVSLAWYSAIVWTIASPGTTGPMLGAVPAAMLALATLAVLAVRACTLLRTQLLLGAAAAHALPSAAFLVGVWAMVDRAHGGNQAVQAPVEWGSLVLAALGSAVVLGGRGSKWPVAREVGRVGIAAAAFAAVLAAVSRASDGTVPGTWAAHWLMNPGTAAAVVSLLALGLLHGGLPQQSGTMIGASIVGAVAYIATVVMRVLDPSVTPPFSTSVAMQRAATSAWLGVAGLSLVIAGFRASSGTVRWIGLCTLAFTAGKVLLYDMSGAEPAWRVAALVVTGILIVASSVVYARATRSG